MKRLLLSQRTDIGPYGNSFDWLEHNYVQYFGGLGYELLPVPNYEPSVKVLLTNDFDAVVLTGGGVFRNYGDISEAQHRCYDSRCKVEKQLIEYSITHGIPLFGICRGMQRINAYFGGKETPITDYICPGQEHQIEAFNRVLRVNHYHSLEITLDNLGERLDPIAIDLAHRSVEAFQGENILGIQWHPERFLSDAVSREWTDELIRNFI